MSKWNPIDAVFPVASIANGGFGSKARDFFGGTPQRTNPVEIPGIIDRPEAAGYLRRGVGMTGQPMPDSGLFYKYLENTSPNASPYGQRLTDMLTNPTFGPTTDAQNQLVSRAYSGRQAQFNNLGIGDSPAAQSAIAAAAAPTLERFRQDQIGNLFNAQGQYQQNAQNSLSAVMGRIDQQLKARGLDLNTLLNASEMGRPQVASQGTGPQRGLFDYVTQGLGALSGFSHGGGGGGAVTG